MRIILGIALAPFALTLVFFIVPPVSSVMLQSLLTGQGMKRDWVPISKISLAMLNATIAAEDGRFCEHYGIDWQAVDATLEKNEHSKRLHGASTITMQVAKNLFLWNGRSWLRKVLEAPLALWIDLVLPKRRILEIYLNIAEWGDGVFGVEQGARRAFGKSAAKLTAREAALLAAALPNPDDRNAGRPSAYHAALAARIQARMSQAPDGANCTR